eukprot:gb/GECG01007693.1/.p1 GENE.gb/GECG01007693.1/~~gb/GECG01007693.1/.p1  ORF type:complete len:2019 (+),score=262.33 gb/GECG01007693.1/:1-6057(+)
MSKSTGGAEAARKEVTTPSYVSSSDRSISQSQQRPASQQQDVWKTPLFNVPVDERITCVGGFLPKLAKDGKTYLKNLIHYFQHRAQAEINFGTSLLNLSASVDLHKDSFAQQFDHLNHYGLLHASQRKQSGSSRAPPPPSQDGNHESSTQQGHGESTQPKVASGFHTTLNAGAHSFVRSSRTEAQARIDFGKYLESKTIPRAQSLLEWLRDEKLRLENLEKEINQDKEKIEAQLQKEHSKYNKCMNYYYSEVSQEIEKNTAGTAEYGKVAARCKKAQEDIERAEVSLKKCIAEHQEVHRRHARIRREIAKSYIVTEEQRLSDITDMLQDVSKAYGKLLEEVSNAEEPAKAEINNISPQFDVKRHIELVLHDLLHRHLVSRSAEFIAERKTDGGDDSNRFSGPQQLIQHCSSVARKKCHMLQKERYHKLKDAVNGSWDECFSGSFSSCAVDDRPPPPAEPLELDMPSTFSMEVKCRGSQQCFRAVSDVFKTRMFEPDLTCEGGFPALATASGLSCASLFHMAAVEHVACRGVQLISLVQKWDENSFQSSLFEANAGQTLQHKLRALIRDLFHHDSAGTEYSFPKHRIGEKDEELPYCMLQPMLSVIPSIRSSCSNRKPSDEASKQRRVYTLFDDGVYFRLTLLRQYLQQEGLTIVQRAQGILRQLFAILCCFVANQNLSNDISEDPKWNGLVETCRTAIEPSLEQISSPPRGSRRQSRAAAKSSTFRSLELAVDALIDRIEGVADAGAECHPCSTFGMGTKGGKSVSVTVLKGGIAPSLKSLYVQSALAPILVQLQPGDGYNVMTLNDALLSLTDVHLASEAGAISVLSLLLGEGSRLLPNTNNRSCFSSFVSACFSEGFLRCWMPANETKSAGENGLCLLHPEEANAVASVWGNAETTQPTPRGKVVLQLLAVLGTELEPSVSSTAMREVFGALLVTNSYLVEQNVTFLELSKRGIQPQNETIPGFLDIAAASPSKSAPDITQTGELALWILDNPVKVSKGNSAATQEILFLYERSTDVDTLSTYALSQLQSPERYSSWIGEIFAAVWSSCFVPGLALRDLSSFVLDNAELYSADIRENCDSAVRCLHASDEALQSLEFYAQVVSLCQTPPRDSQSTVSKLSGVALSTSIALRRFLNGASLEQTSTEIWSQGSNTYHELCETLRLLPTEDCPHRLRKLLHDDRNFVIFVHALLGETRASLSRNIWWNKERLLRRTLTTSDSLLEGCFSDLALMCKSVVELDEAIDLLSASLEEQLSTPDRAFQECADSVFGSSAHTAEAYLPLLSMRKLLKSSRESCNKDADADDRGIPRNLCAAATSHELREVLNLQRRCLSRFTQEVATQQLQVWRSIERAIGFGCDGFYVADTTFDTVAYDSKRAAPQSTTSYNFLDDFLAQFCDVSKASDGDGSGRISYGLTRDSASTIALSHLSRVYKNVLSVSVSEFARSQQTLWTREDPGFLVSVKALLADHCSVAVKDLGEDYPRIICQEMTSRDLMNLIPPLPGKEKQHPKWGEQTSYGRLASPGSSSETTSQHRMVNEKYSEDMRLRYASKQSDFSATGNSSNLGSRLYSVAAALKEKCSNGEDVKSLVPASVKAKENGSSVEGGETEKSSLPRVPSIGTSDHQVSAAILNVYSQRVNDLIELRNVLSDCLVDSASVLQVKEDDPLPKSFREVIGGLQERAVSTVNFIACHLIFLQARSSLLYNLYRPRPIESRLVDILGHLEELVQSVYVNLRPPCNRIFLIRCIECVTECWVRATLIDHRQQCIVFLCALQKLQGLRENYFQEVSANSEHSNSKETLRGKASNFFKRAFTAKPDSDVDNRNKELAAAEASIPPKSLPQPEGYVIAQDAQALKRWLGSEAVSELLLQSSSTMSSESYALVYSLGYGISGKEHTYLDVDFWDQFQHSTPAKEIWGLDKSEKENLLQSLIIDFVPLLNKDSHSLIEQFEIFVEQTDSLTPAKFALPLELPPLPSTILSSPFERKRAAALLIIHKAAEGCKECAKVCSKRKLVESFGWWK